MNYIDRNKIAYNFFLSQPYATEVCDGRSWRHKLKCQSLFVIKRNSNWLVETCFYEGNSRISELCDKET